MEERLSKTLALAGVASRRESDAIIADGRVTVNGAVITEPGYRVDITRDHIKVDNRLLQAQTPEYLLLNKPAGVLSTRTDPEGRPTVVSLLRNVKGRLMPVGKLDWEDEGAMLLTSNSPMAAVLNDAQSGIPRTYLVKIRGVPDDRTLERLRTGVSLEGGRSRPLEAAVVSVTGRNTWLQLTLREMRPQLIKRIMLKLRHPVSKIRCLAFATLSVKGLRPGTFRKLVPEEIARLQALMDNPPGLPALQHPTDEVVEGPGADRQPTGPLLAPVPRARKKPTPLPPAPPVKANQRGRITRNEVAKSRAIGRPDRKKGAPRSSR